MSSSSENSILLSLKKEPLDNLTVTIHPEIPSDVTLDGNELLHHLESRPNAIHEEVKVESTESFTINNKEANNDYSNTKFVRKRGRRKKLIEGREFNPNNPQRSFSFKWLRKPELREWLIPVPTKPSHVSCKWCKAILRAHLHDLKKHALSKKHRKHSVLYSNINTRRQESYVNINNYFENSIGGHSDHEITVSVHENGKATSSEVSSENLNPAHIGFIGAGNMAQALISGFISNGLVEPNNVVVSAPSSRNLEKLKPLGIKTTHENKTVIEESDMVFLAVKPHIIPEVLGRLEPLEGSHNPLFLSIAAGLTLTRLEAMLSHIVTLPRVIRIMPNTPCMVLQGCSVYSLGTNVQTAEGKTIKCLLGSVGLCEQVAEYQIDAVCGVAGSGPAYIYAAIEAMADGGVKMGLPRSLSLALAAQTVRGAASMVIETGKHPAQLKDDVCSPSGTTIAAVHALEKNGLRNALISAVEASATRSKELG